ncbi:alanine--glyoxylate aminotransferase family protein [Pseudorhodobacter sp.]|uniref:pyridoxal-phosphate-dependent aminotransferase family protein n=1 Tax=Pseudorhodobacter sp. TaxID=1934400 RepID=UPI0026496FE1|nr:aminotransferase class V-fold PLP-dependent enzyme [Pseudorhodobacter sp.]MDN5787333.1 aminotransferase class V-fold PLP-dependent enzyme [Pseudorhodobacter sp.]
MSPSLSLANGRSYLAIPGPSVMPDRVLRAMHRAGPNIYGGEIHDVVAGIWPRLKAVAGTSQNSAIYIANGHGTWEAANCNIFSKGDKALVLAVGRFGIGWSESARALGVDVELLDFGKSSPVDLGRVEAALRADKDHKIKALLTTQVDTSSSIKTDIASLRGVLDAVGHPALLAVDCIASIGCDEYRMDDWGVDVTVAASQKGLMTPPGLGVLWFSDRARERCRGNDLRTPYWDWEPRANGTEFWQYFNGTAPTHHLYGLAEALLMLEEEGMANVWARHRALAGAVWAAFEVWSKGNPAIAMNVANARDRGCSVTAARIGGNDATRLREWCETQAGVTLGIGLGMALPGDAAWHGFLRVAHMGHVNAHMTLGVLAVMEAGMQALDIAHGEGGVLAATKALSSAWVQGQA